MKRFDVCVRGAGIVGQSLALALARQGWQVALILDPTPATAREDVRAYALNAASIELLRSLKVWDALPPSARTPVHDMLIQGDAQGTLEFSAWQQHVGELAWITDAPVLERALADAVRYAPHVTVTAGPVEAELTALCEGRNSAARDALGVSWERHDYGHVAIAARLTAERPHGNVARQWFGAPEVLALLPFDAPSPGHSHALVWSLPQARADELLGLDAAAFDAELVRATGGVCGALNVTSERAAWPLMRARASSWCGPGWVLLGDAAHVVHPLAGQGLNLGLADVAALAETIAQRETWRPISDAKLLRRYERARDLPTRAMGELTDGLWMLFSAQPPGWRELRNRGMGLVNSLTPLKRWLTARALNS